VTGLGWVGVWLLTASAAVIVIETAVAGVWAGRLARRARTVAGQIQSEQALLQADVEKLRALIEETRRLWQPYARALRWLRHPLVAALLVSLRRRWVGA
jgi:hypothetical protein